MALQAQRAERGLNEDLEQDDVTDEQIKVMVNRLARRVFPRYEQDDGVQDKQATWEEARLALNLTTRQAKGVSIGKLMLWHWSQPVAYFYVLYAFFCTLNRWQRIFGCVVAAREGIYLISTLVALQLCPVYRPRSLYVPSKSCCVWGRL
jgi:drug/metabolite transporter superfamily protein YnfA